MGEERVTKAILKWLIGNGWEIICFDFPQSGTGRLLHPNGTNEKNKGAINPDIIAVRNGVCLFFENKDRFYFPDFEKVNELIVHDDYSEATTTLLAGRLAERYFYGIGLPASKHTRASQKAAYLVDFIVGVEEDGSVAAVYNPREIVF